MTQIEQQIKDYLLKEFLPGEDPSQLAVDTPLITSGVLDSIAALQLVQFLEEQFSISMASHETGADYLDSIGRIAQLVVEKGGKGG